MDFHGASEDRRQVERVVLDSPWFIEATIGNYTCDGSIIDFSHAGAKIQTVGRDTSVSYQSGQTCKFLVHLPSGRKIPVSGMLSWSFRLPEGCLLGVQFTDPVDHQILYESRNSNQAKIT